MRVLQAKWNSKEKKKKNFKQNKKENINDYIISFVLILSVLWSNKQIRFAYTIPASWLYYLFLYLINSLDLFNIRHDTRWLHTCLWIIHLLYIHVQFLSLFRSIVDRNIFLNFKRRGFNGLNFSHALFHFFSLTRRGYRFIGYDPSDRKIFFQVSKLAGG